MYNIAMQVFAVFFLVRVVAAAASCEARDSERCIHSIVGALPGLSGQGSAPDIKPSAWNGTAYIVSLEQPVSPQSALDHEFWEIIRSCIVPKEEWRVGPLHNDESLVIGWAGVPLDEIGLGKLQANPALRVVQNKYRSRLDDEDDKYLGRRARYEHEWAMGRGGQSHSVWRKIKSWMRRAVDWPRLFKREDGQIWVKTYGTWNLALISKPPGVKLNKRESRKYIQDSRQGEGSFVWLVDHGVQGSVKNVSVCILTMVNLQH